MAVVVVEKDGARVWAHGTEGHHEPEVVVPPDAKRRHPHVRTGEDDHMHHRDSGEPPYFEAIAHSVAGAGRLLLIGHGKGKGSEMERFRSYVEHKYPRLAANIIGSLRVNLEALTDHQILALARGWYEDQVRIGAIE